jgi:RNA recognition motif-containing protein
MGKKESIDGDDELSSLATSIIATIRSSENGMSMDIKDLRSSVLTTLDLPVDKSSKKVFKSVVKLMEEDKRLSLNSEGVVKLSKSERAGDKAASKDIEPKSEEKKKKKKDKKRKRELKDIGDEMGRDNKDDNDQNGADEGKSMKTKLLLTGDNDDETDITNHEEEDIQHELGTDKTDSKDKNKPCKNNPQGITRLFVGNLPFAITEPTLSTHLKECVTHVKWITDKATGKFYGSAFVEVQNSKDAAMCISQINGTMLMGRPVKINYAPVRSGEENDWPPRSRVITGGKVANSGGGQAGGSGIKAMSAKPEGCCKLFIGNLSYDIDDEGITKFFMGVESELKAVRWLYHQDSGDFKGW